MTATGPQPTVSYAGYNRKFLSAAIGAVGSPRARQTNMHCQTRMADGFEKSWRALLPDLQPAPRILHAAQLGCTRRGGTAGDTA